MKKVISTVAALALAAAMATSAFAAGGYSKDELKAIAGGYAGQAAAYGVSMDQVNAAIDGLTDPASVDVDAVKAAAVKAQAALQTANSQKEITDIVNTALTEMKAAAGNNSVEVGDVTVQLNLDGSATVKASVKVGGVAITAEKSTPANAERAPEWTDSSKKDTTTATSGAAASTAGVIKATGLNTTGAAVVALAVASVLGAAAVKARKLGE
ncbi:hypothetical protein B5G38_04150 [Gemmiger sp. An87]|nr:hypothetical protein B5G38_04150 [Gemmiger sp. An87]